MPGLLASSRSLDEARPARLDMSESAVSHQLRLLRSARIVRSRRDGRMIFYALDDKHVLTLFRQGLKHVQENGRHAVR